MKSVYFTVDDGPLSGMSNIISVVNELEVVLNMMLVGIHINTDMKKKLVTDAKNNRFITVGNHSYCHAYEHYLRFYDDPENVLADFNHNASILDVNNKFARLPGRNMWQVGNRSKYDVESGQTSAQLLHKNGYTVFGWDLEWQHDPKTGTPLQSVDNFIDEIERQFSNTFTPDHLVILAHDEMFGNETEKGQIHELLQRLSRLYTLKSIADYPLS